ncbi:MAG TPA: sulfotransferase [Solirubrobacteraceae bacterium]|nr:sulfotransferase [Solirubrobacteraceae bacterium]
MGGEHHSSTAARVPDFFIAGHAKSGTTALYMILRRHPQIYMPALKEPQFFAPEMRSEARLARELPATLEEYLALFADAAPGQLTGEASPSYLRSPTAAGEIAKLAPQARIVAVFREPASFLHSLHLQFVQTMIETETDLRRALELEEQRAAGRALPRGAGSSEPYMYSRHVRYAEQLERWQGAFSPEQVLPLVYEDFRSDNEATARQIMRFLGVDDSVEIRAIEANPTVRVRAGRLHGLKRAVHNAQGPVARAVKGSVNAAIPAGVRRSVVRPLRRQLRRKVVFAAPEPPEEELMSELRGRFRGEVAALSALLGRDLETLWGYRDGG